MDEVLLQRILEAGTRASNTGNMQIYSIIVTTDPQIREQLSPCHFGQPMVTQAPIVLTFCVDVRRFSLWCRQRGADPQYDNFVWFVNGAIDAILASQNVCLEAESEGLGICYLGTTTYNADRIAEVLALPEGVIPVTTVTMGYPDKLPPPTDRLPLEGVIHREHARSDRRDLGRQGSFRRDGRPAESERPTEPGAYFHRTSLQGRRQPSFFAEIFRNAEKTGVLQPVRTRKTDRIWKRFTKKRSRCYNGAK